MSVTQDYNLLMSWRNLLAARIAFFEPMGTHTTLVREIKAELKTINEKLAAADEAGACDAHSGDYTVLTLTRTEREQVVMLLATHINTIQRDLKLVPVDLLSLRATMNDALAATQSAYAKVRA